MAPYFIMFDGTTGVVKSVQYVSITIASSGTSNTATITAVDTAKTAIFYGGMRGSDGATNYDDDQAILTLTNSTTITATRVGAGSPTLTVNAAIVEFEAAAVSSIQYGSIALGSGVTSNTATISSITTTRTAVLYTGATSTNGNGNLATNCPRVSLTNATTVTASRNTGTGTVVAGFVAIEFASGITTSVQQGTVQLSNVTSNTATISSVDTARSMLVWGGFSGTSNSSAPRFMPAITLTNGTTVTGSRQVASTDTSDVNFTVIEFASGLVKAVDRSVLTIATSADTQTDTVAAVVVNKTIVNWLGCNNSQADTSYADNYSTVTLTNTTTVTVQRFDTDASSTEFVGYNLVEFN